ncbi:MAG: hypothetical protein RBU37_18475, partial [Myxococcota bacterium]|nr:hypothetical protein [Myxococcota bacterium]
MSIAKHFLRSIELLSDLAHPERLAHFYPTSKSLRILHAVMSTESSASTMVIASYGTGKSLAAGIAGLLVRNELSSQSILAPVVDRISVFEPVFAARMRERMGSARQGQVIVLSGHVPQLAAALLGLGADERCSMSEALAKLSQSTQGRDRLAIIWDEFGRHLEALIANGASHELADVQQLAEWVVRQSDTPATLTLLLHQGILAYADRLNQSARQGWRKVEGRFESIRLIDDSRELYELIASLVSEARVGVFGGGDSLKEAKQALAHGWFEAFEGAPEQLGVVLEKARPLTPAALRTLPLLTARLAQNERSIFSFLHQAELSKPVGLEELYLYFSEAMRMDTGLGGTYRRWLETESARSTAEDDFEREILAAACLLGLGVGGERRRLTSSALVAAFDASARAEVKRRVQKLIARKLLLHRKRNDDISVWHGADVDLRARLDEEKGRAESSFELVAFLETNHPAPVIRPAACYVESGVVRFFAPHYVTANALLVPAAQFEFTQLRPGEDGRILYVVVESKEELDAVQALVVSQEPMPSGVIVVLPRQPLVLTDAALEVHCLLRMREDRELLGLDPLVLAELNELLMVAREHFELQMAHLCEPQSEWSQW